MIPFDFSSLMPLVIHSSSQLSYALYGFDVSPSSILLLLLSALAYYFFFFFFYSLGLCYLNIRSWRKAVYVFG